MQNWKDGIKDKKVVFFVAETIPSSAGGGRNAFYFARFLLSKGAKPQIVCLNYNNKLPKRQISEGVQIIRISYYNKNLVSKFFSLFFLIHSYINLVRSGEIFIIYGRYLPGYVSILIAGYFFLKQIIFRSTLLNDDDIQSIKKQSGLLWPLYKFAFKRISLYYAINKKFEKIWKDVFLNTVPVVSIAQGVDGRIFNGSIRKAMHTNSNKELKILSCGILVERKGYRHAFQSLSKLDIPFKYTVIGQYMPDKYHRSSAKEAREMELLFNLGKELLGNKLEFLYIADNMQDYYAAADLFIHLAEDEFPNVVLEAMAMGLPVIARDIKELSNIVKPGENIELVHSEVELCGLIKKIYFNPEYAGHLGDNAAITIAQKFDFNDIASELLQKLKLD